MTATHNQATGKSTKKASEGNSWAKATTGRGKSQTGSKDKHVSLIQRALDNKDWQVARSLVQEELVLQPMDHWLWFTLSLTYYEDRDYEKARACSKRAVELAPDCPLALWHYAGSLYMTGREASALVIWTVLLNMDMEEIAYHGHGEGMDWALQLVNDVHYRIGRYYQHLGETDLARESFAKYLHNREHGAGSIYDKREVESYLSETR
jgi:tetratricopeptide (TPR) repeat protein